MNKIRGKVMGGLLGLLAGGPVGAAFGLVVGHMYDKRQESGGNPWANLVDSYADFSGTVQQANFTIGVIVLGAKMAKADGRVTRAEIEAFKRVFNVSPAQENSVGRLFNRARTSATGFEPYAFQLAHTFRNNPVVLEQVLGGLFIIAASDSAGLSPAEIRFLKNVAGIFGFGEADFARIAARAGVPLPGGAGTTPPPRDEARESYEILGVRAEASAEEIKVAYRALIREHHPDRLIAQGLPPEFVATASEKMKRINVAYDVICRIKGIK
jgi:DnaJ like chaperone protein